jgi:hypothetical protein
MHARRIVVGAVGATLVASLLACATGSTANADRPSTNPVVPERSERGRTGGAGAHSARVPSAAPKHEPAPEQVILAPAAHPPPQRGLAMLGELATAQALIVSLIVAPFSHRKVESESSQDSRVPR